MKKGCPCSPPLFSIVYGWLPKQLVIKHPNAFVYVDDMAIIVKSHDEFECVFADASVWGSQIGIRCIPEKIEVFYFHRASQNTYGEETTACQFVNLSSRTWDTPSGTKHK